MALLYEECPFLTLWHKFKLCDAVTLVLRKSMKSTSQLSFKTDSGLRVTVESTKHTVKWLQLSLCTQSNHEFPHRTSKHCLYLNTRWPCKFEAQKENAHMSWCVAGWSPALCCTCRWGVPGTEGHCSDSCDKCS